MTDYATQFLDPSKPRTKNKKTYQPIEEDYDLIRRCFPQHGFMNAFVGFCLHQLALNLKHRNVKTNDEREKQGYTVGHVLSDFRTDRNTD